MIDDSTSTNGHLLVGKIYNFPFSWKSLDDKVYFCQNICKWSLVVKVINIIYATKYLMTWTMYIMLMLMFIYI